MIFKISYIKEEKYIASMVFTECLRKLGVSENSKVCWNESIVKLTKVDEMFNNLILKSSLATGYWWRDKDRIGRSKFFVGAFTTPLLY